MFRHKNCVVDQRADARFRFNSREPFPHLEKRNPVPQRWSGLPAKTIEPKRVAMVANSESFRMIEAFKNLTDDQRSRVMPLCEELVFHEGDRLFAEGDPAQHVWFVIDGQVGLRFELPDRRRTTTEHTLSSEEASRQDAEAKKMGWSCFVPPYQMMPSA